MGDFSGKKVLITGGGGFIGSHLVEALLREGAEVKAFVRYNSRGDPGLLRLLDRELLSQVKIEPGDLQDEDAVRKAVRGSQLVFHLGALISIPYSYHHPVETAKTNLLGTLNVLSACREYAVERLVHTSSSEVYGTARIIPINEQHPLQGQSPYSASKIGADKLVESFFDSYNLPFVTVRPFNTYGPRQSARGVIPTIITQALVKEEIRLGNTNSSRDFTYVDDTVSGFLRAAATSEAIGGTFNLGTGTEIRIGELADLVLRLVGRNVPILLDERRLRPEASEVQRLISDNSVAKSVLGWAPQIPFEEGLRRTINWISENLERYKVGSYEF